MGEQAFGGTLRTAPVAASRRSLHAKSVQDWAVASDPGLGQGHNEDAWRIEPELGAFALADGMGGYNAGEVASAIAVDVALAQPFDQPAGASSPDPLEQLARAVSAANASILAAAARRPQCLGMGTTLALAWIAGTRLFHAHVGDSRIYLLRGHELLRLTRDHTVGQAMIDSGSVEPASSRAAAFRGVLTRALGVEPSVAPDLGEVELRPGDRVLLCSDGLSDPLDDGAIRALLDTGDRAAAQAAALVQAALAAGSLDNITAVVAVAPGEPPANGPA